MILSNKSIPSQCTEYIGGKSTDSLSGECGCSCDVAVVAGAMLSLLGQCRFLKVYGVRFRLVIEQLKISRNVRICLLKVPINAGKTCPSELCWMQSSNCHGTQPC